MAIDLGDLMMRKSVRSSSLSNDYHIAYRPWGFGKSVAWQLDPSTIIARVDLSEHCYHLEKLRASIPST
ncbi:MAG: hypothetical protein JO334_11380 [Verrucomicrobia bacterium]|nr:hypothetical protein [Verrucomicrobiota bacterium]